MITTTDVLLAAASLAERQPTASAAIGAALRFTDRFPYAGTALEIAEGRDPHQSLYHALAAHYVKPGAVAGAFRHAAGMVTA